MNHWKAFEQGAKHMASRTPRQMQEMGMNIEEYETLTSPEPWLPQDCQRMRGVLAHALNVSLSFANLPARALPAQYVAAVIATIVSPVNWLVAATIAPEAFDAMEAEFTDEQFNPRPVKYEQMISLVMSYAGGSRRQAPDQIIRDEVDPERMEA